MKLIIAIIRPEVLPCLQLTLQRLDIDSMMVTETHVHNQHEGHILLYGSSEIRVRSAPKLRLELIVDDLDADDVVDAIEESGVPDKGNLKKNCKIFVVSLDHYRDLAQKEAAAMPVRSR